MVNVTVLLKKKTKRLHMATVSATLAGKEKSVTRSSVPMAALVAVFVAMASATVSPDTLEPHASALFNALTTVLETTACASLTQMHRKVPRVFVFANPSGLVKTATTLVAAATVTTVASALKENVSVKMVTLAVNARLPAPNAAADTEFALPAHVPAILAFLVTTAIERRHAPVTTLLLENVHAVEVASNHVVNASALQVTLATIAAN